MIITIVHDLHTPIPGARIHETVRFANKFQIVGISKSRAHNHPSGDPKPSRDDIEMTREAKALGIAIHDHLVIGRKGRASFRSLGLL